MIQPTKIKIYAQKAEGKPLEYNRQQLIEFSHSAKSGCYTIEIRRSVKDKSSRQVKAIFWMIEQTIVQANDLGIDVSYLLKYLLNEYEPKGTGLTKDLLHELIYVICPTTDEDGRRITLSKMSSKQAADLFDRFRAIVAPLGIVIPDPNPNWNTKK